MKLNSVKERATSNPLLFRVQTKNIYAEKRLKPPIARKDQIRLFVLEK